MSDLAIRARRAVDEADATIMTLDRCNVLIAVVCGFFLGVMCAAFV